MASARNDENQTEVFYVKEKEFTVHLELFQAIFGQSTILSHILERGTQNKVIHRTENAKQTDSEKCPQRSVRRQHGNMQRSKVTRETILSLFVMSRRFSESLGIWRIKIDNQGRKRHEQMQTHING
jgi:hypothetical protein